MNENYPRSKRFQIGSWIAMGVVFLALTALVANSCRAGGTIGSGDIMQVAADRGFTEEDVMRAVKSFVPPGGKDEYLLFASGGHSGQIHVLGVPSLRLLKTIAVFTPEPWQGYGYGADWSTEALGGGDGDEGALRWGDSHHPALSETNGEYDGRWIYINDRAHGRIAMVDLSDFRTKQIVNVPNVQTSHGGIFATPNTRYVHISSMVPALKNWNPEVGGSITVEEHLERYADIYRGYSTFLRIDETTGRMNVKESFQLELPPYTQDLADAGKGVSDGWAFINSYNSEMATGGIEFGRPPLEAGASKGDFDYLHIVNWKKAEELVAAGKYTEINGIRQISIETAIAEGILFLAPEPRSPHGVDIAPRGDYITISGKLDPNVTVYSMEMILRAIEKKDYEGHDHYGIPILRFDAVVAGQVEVGAGPLHTQYDDRGYGYTSLFLESAIARWTLGEPYNSKDEGFKLVDKIGIHYNVGHLATTEGDTMAPKGKYLVSLNKWAIDRHTNVGPLHPQNFQLIDISGDEMQLLADMPIGFGEPHYAQIIRADTVKGKVFYEMGHSPATGELSPNSLKKAEDARVEHRPGEVEVWMNVIRSQFQPDIIRAKKGDKITIHLSNTEQAQDATHGFAVPSRNIMVSLDAGETTTVEFIADTPGSFSFYCTEFCSALHLEMQGWLIVEGG